ncbi:MAG: c-type heme family protein [Bryobacteraceae bacterium]
MKLLGRFNLIFIVVFGVGLAAAAWLAYLSLSADAKATVLSQARLMMETTLATRAYTDQQIGPLLAREQKHDRNFIPQTVPAFAATQVFDFVHKRNPSYSYKEATLNPTDPIDRASDWEADVINAFRNHPDRTEVIGERETPTGQSLFLAHPLRVGSPACLECHSTPSAAPASLLREYGPNNGFGWKLGEVVGAQIVSVPESLPLAIARKAFNRLVIYLAALGIVTLIILDLVLITTVTRPASRLSKMADQISKGRMDTEELPVRGRDEISVLAASFNRMQRSLARALRMLESQNEPEDVL